MRRMDPQEIQNRFSDDCSLMQLSTSKFTFEDVQPFLDRLPQREFDLIEMYYRDQKKQKEIAEFFGVTQGAISHRLSRARKRLEFLRDMPKIDGDTEKTVKVTRERLGDYFTAFEVDVIIFMIETTCQSRTAELLNLKYELTGQDCMTQVKVRHKYDRAIDKLKKLKRKHRDLAICLSLAQYIKKNLYMLHEVILPHFNRGQYARYEKIC